MGNISSAMCAAHTEKMSSPRMVMADYCKQSFKYRELVEILRAWVEATYIADKYGGTNEPFVSTPLCLELRRCSNSS